MVILGLVLFLVGWLAGIGVLFWLGLILLIVGLVVNFVPFRGTRRRVW